MKVNKAQNKNNKILAGNKRAPLLMRHSGAKAKMKVASNKAKDSP